MSNVNSSSVAQVLRLGREDVI